MAQKVTEWVWENSSAKNGALLVLLAIADCTNSEHGDGAWPSIAYLTYRSRLSERGVHEAIKKLAEMGELKVLPGGGRGKTNAYQVIMKGSRRAGNAQTMPNPAESAEPGEEPQVTGPDSGPNPAESAPFEETPQFSADGAPVGAQTPQFSAPNPAVFTENGADSAPGTTREPKENLPGYVTTSHNPRAASEFDHENRPGLDPGFLDENSDPGAAAQALIGEWLDHCAERPPDRTIGHAAREIKSLLLERRHPQKVRATIVHWHRRGLGPSQLPNVYYELYAANGPGGNDRSSGNGRFAPGTGQGSPVPAITSVDQVRV